MKPVSRETNSTIYGAVAICWAVFALLAFVLQRYSEGVACLAASRAHAELWCRTR